MTSNKYQNPDFKCKICKGAFNDGQNIVIHVFEHNFDDNVSSWLYHEACKLKRIRKQIKQRLAQNEEQEESIHGGFFGG